MNEAIFRYKLFGGEISVIVYDFPDKEKLEKIMGEFYSEALRWQKIFSFYDVESELSMLNKKRKMAVSDDLLRVVKKGLKFSEMTKGRYDICLGKKIAARKRGEEIEVSCSYKDAEIKGKTIILKNEEVLIDLGSIAKGYITDRLSDFLKLRKVKEFLIDSRGDIVVSGSYKHVIGVQHPREKANSILKIGVENKAVATSGDYKQFYGSYSKSHIINQDKLPEKTSRPISITVIADSLEEADVYATALFVVGEEEQERLMKNNKRIKGMIITEDLGKRMYNNFEEVIEDGLQ